jgi:serine/threonine-protein phosphatase PP1 catalytic subunit
MAFLGKIFGRSKPAEIDLEGVVTKVLDSGSVLQLSETRVLCQKSKELFLAEPVLLQLEAPAVVCGPVDDFAKVFEVGGTPSETKYMFMVRT